jgi:hypothetical protein
MPMYTLFVMSSLHFYLFFSDSYYESFFAGMFS